MSPDLPRWIMASLATFCKDIADDLNVQFFIEGVDEAQAEDFQNDSILFRMTGPSTRQGSGGFEWHLIEMHVLLTDIIQGASLDNAYDILRWAGAYHSALMEAIPIYKMEGTPDPELIGCLRPDTSFKEHLRTVNFNQVDKVGRVRQMSVNARFILDI